MPITNDEFISAAEKEDLDAISNRILDKTVPLDPTVAQNAFIAAARSGKIGTLIYLNELKKELGINVNGYNEQTSETALVAAALNGQTEAVRYLINDAVATINWPSKDGFTALMAAAAIGNEPIVDLLLEQKEQQLTVGILHTTPKSSPDPSQREITALMLAARYGHANIIKTLLEKFPKKEWLPDLINAQDVNGYTALMYAVNFGHADAVKMLLDNGADLSIKDTKGRNALDFVPQGRADLADLIKRASPQEEKKPESLTLEEIESRLRDYEDLSSLELPANPVKVLEKYYDIETIKSLLAANMPVPHTRTPFPPAVIEQVEKGKFDQQAKSEIDRLLKLQKKLQPSALPTPPTEEGVRNSVTIHAPPSPKEEVKADRFHSPAPARLSEMGKFKPKQKAQENREEMEIKNDVEDFARSTIQICRKYLDERQDQDVTPQSRYRQHLASELIRQLNDVDITKSRQDVIDKIYDIFLQPNIAEARRRLGRENVNEALGTLDGLLYSHVKNLEEILNPKPKHSR